jgi:hypothetical protein
LILHAEALAAGLAIDHAPVVQAYAAKYDEQVDLEYLPGQPGMDDNLLFQIAPKRAISWEVASSDNWVNRRWQVGA